MSYTFSPHVAAREISIFSPFLLCVSSWASSLFTQGQKKSLRKVKGSLGPLSWPTTAFFCHFLSSIIVLPRNSSISLEIRLFFLGNAPFRELILGSLCSLQSSFVRTFLLIPIFCLLRFCFHCSGCAGNICILSDCGELCRNLTPYVFLYWKSQDLYFAFLNHEPSSISHPSQGQLRPACLSTSEFPEKPGNLVLLSLIVA